MIDETLGNYRIVSLIGEGGMGVVYRAEHTLLGRKAAIKVLRSEISQELVERFFNEARAAAMLHHPSCVDVFDFGHRADGSAFIVMELLEGEPLSERLDRETRLPVPLAAAIGRQVASALHVAHKQGIIHRDLKPGNIYLINEPEAPAGLRAKVLDFGIAKLVRDPVPRSVKTNSGAVFGTPRYMSPEQCRNARSVDGRSDVYSLGCILYEMLLGVAPFDYDSWGELVGAHLHETPPKPSELDEKLPMDVEMILLTALEKKPEDRYQTMHEFAQAIESLWKHHGSPRTPFTPPSGIRALGMGSDDTVPPPGGSSPGIVIPGRSSPPTPSEPPQRGSGRSSPPTPSEPPQRGSGRIETRSSSPRISPGGSSPRLDVASGTDDTDMSATPFENTALSSARIAMADTAAPQSTPVGAQLLSASLAKRPIVWVSVGAAVAIAGGVTIWTLARSTTRAKADTDGVIAVVDRRDEPADSAAPRVDAGTAAVVAPPDAAPRSHTPPGHTRRDPNETDTALLTRTFGHQTPAVQACFRDHPQQVDGAISIRIKINVAGAVGSAEVLPAGLASTPLGTCLAGVARGTAFGPQPKAATFRVPINVGRRP